jgi:DedD protein
MDKKRTQRILGILVIIALVIILFPLLSGKSEQPTNDTTALKTPKFPEPEQPPSAIAAEDTDNAMTPALPIDGNAPQSVTSDNPTQELSEAKPNDAQQGSAPTEVQPAISMDMNERPHAEISAIQPGTADEDATSIVKVINEPEKTTPKTLDAAKPPQAKMVSADKKRISNHTKPTHKTEKDLAKLNAKAWVVQMGSFKDKANARHLVDTLRLAGYKAFTYDVKSRNGNMRTRVYIGPEYKQASAINLSTKIEQEMMLHGIIVSYQPLSL